MLVHIVADDQNKISELRSLLGSQDRITSVLLNDESGVPKECDATIVAVDLRNADNIAALKEVSATFNNTPRKIFVIDQKVRLFAAQAYALGATRWRLLRQLAVESAPLSQWPLCRPRPDVARRLAGRLGHLRETVPHPSLPGTQPRRPCARPPP